MKKAFLQLHFAVFLAGFTGVLGRLITLNAVPANQIVEPRNVPKQKASNIRAADLWFHLRLSVAAL